MGGLSAGHQKFPPPKSSKVAGLPLVVPVNVAPIRPHGAGETAIFADWAGHTFSAR